MLWINRGAVYDGAEGELFFAAVPCCQHGVGEAEIHGDALSAVEEA
ncbi:MAG TPA: hypothetical protein VNY06_05715 [Methylocella sp.]|jgi:hypothetical protein|nr:hypothetical protein [Methylocella sp.]